MSNAATRTRWIAIGVLVATSLAWAGPAAGSTKPTRDNNCVHPSGVSFNEVFDVPEQFVNPLCPGLTAGEHWRPTVGWFAAETDDAVYPPGYVPLHPDPIDDALAKLMIKVVIDGGTSQEKTYLFTPDEAVAFVRIHEINPAFPDMPGFFLIPRMGPLSAGHHTHEMILVLSAQHCDGTSTDALSCLPAGDFSAFGVRPTDVATPEPVGGS